MIHSFNIKIAENLGIEDAILIHNFYFWIKKNVANEQHLHDGKYWVYNSVSAFAELFPYMSKAKIVRVLTKLEKTGHICKGNFNKNTFDRTAWYAFTEKGVKVLSDCGYDTHNFILSKSNDANCENAITQNEKMQDCKMSSSIYSNCENGFTQNEQMDLCNLCTPIPNINTNNIPDKREKKEIEDKSSIKKEKNFSQLATSFETKWESVTAEIQQDLYWVAKIEKDWGIDCATILARFKEHIIKNGKIEEVTENAQKMKQWCANSAQYFLKDMANENVNLGKAEYMREGKRYYKHYGKEYEAPLGAPPRPSEVYVWSVDNKWVYDGI